MLRYPLILTPDDNDTLLVTSPDFPEFKTFGDNEDDAVSRAADALVTVIAARIADREAIPVPSTMTGPAVLLGAGEALKIALYRAMEADGVDRAELAHRIDRSASQVDRLLDLLRASPLDQLEAALRALGRDITILVDKAA